MSFEKQSAPVLDLSGGCRVWKFVELELGVTMAFQPAPNQCNAHGCVNPDDRFYWVPFGVRLVAPLAWKRVEVSVGGGGLYHDRWFSVAPRSLSGGNRRSLPAMISYFRRAGFHSQFTRGV